ncbi:MAG: TonB family protein [Bdellovibrionales bacterium]|nr:TonB family protein [Bdellovibrionales bacterium]
MLYKLNVKALEALNEFSQWLKIEQALAWIEAKLRPYTPIQISSGLHVAIVLVAMIVAFSPKFKKEDVEITIIENPAASQAAVLPNRPIVPKKESTQKRGVFGASRKSITSDTGEAVKAGNTVAKEVDDKKLTAADADSLPIPADEFLVSEMPKLEAEVRIPYPPQAREKKVQGAVVMDILIDAEGRVRQASLVSGPGAGLNEAALEAVKGFKFRPARIQTQSVAVKIRYSYRFVLE